MTAVGAKARKIFGFANVSKQIFANPYTSLSAILSPAGGFLSFPVTDICHSRNKNILGLFKGYYFAITGRNSMAFTAIIQMYFAGAIPVTGL